ncbi:MAG: NADH-quinone oxidoreductase subunit J [Oligoflexia bacterium]|nr:NADH-quinone oxidoreductase subunit J [Oligoflexia bacterium]
MDISPFFFYLFGGLAILFSLFVVLKKSPVASAFSLVLVFFSFAAIYAVLGAHLIAALQVLVYAGAIMVLFIFVIMLLNQDVPSFDIARTHVVIRAVAVVATVALFGAFVWVFKNSALPAARGGFSASAIEMAGGNTVVVSELMFNQYILPFEVTSILLLAAMVGAVAIAKRQKSSAEVLREAAANQRKQAGRAAVGGAK